MVFVLCRSARVPVWHIDQHPPGKDDVGRIWDEADQVPPNKKPHIVVQPLGENLEAMVEQAQWSNPTTFEPTDTTPIESI